jgi:hypothetical protein
MRFSARVRPWLGLGILLSCAAPGSAVDFTSSPLPIVVIDTDGREISDEPKTTAHLGVIDGGEGRRNSPSGAFNAYDGPIGIEIRGSSSKMFPKKNYAFETRDDSGRPFNVPLLGFPPENDWVLYGPYTDKSLMRNALAYALSNAMGRYASRTRACELVLNGDYRGVYFLMEKIKRDRNRVDVSGLNSTGNSGDSLTGGYIVKIDKPDGAGNAGWFSEYRSDSVYRKLIEYQFHYPKPEDITREQAAYIRSVIGRFEDAMAGGFYADPMRGYPRLIRTDTFADNFILSELAKNVDSYRLSMFLAKDRDGVDGRLRAGPVWDMDLGFGNADYYEGWAADGWEMDFLTADPDFRGSDRYQVPFWWKRLRQDSAFQVLVHERWESLRRGPLGTESINALIDGFAAELSEPQARNFERWPVLDEYVWPNAYIGFTWPAEVAHLKAWIADRLDWMDEAIVPPDSQFVPAPQIYSVNQNYPNPFSGSTTFRYQLPGTADVSVTVYAVSGREVRGWRMQAEPPGWKTLIWDGCDDSGRAVASGVYAAHVTAGPLRQSLKLVVVR